MKRIILISCIVFSCLLGSTLAIAREHESKLYAGSADIPRIFSAPSIYKLS